MQAQDPACVRVLQERTLHTTGSCAAGWELSKGQQRLINSPRCHLLHGAVQEGLTRPGHGGRGGRAQVADLEQQPHRGVQRDPLVAGQGQHLCVQTDRQTASLELSQEQE